MTSYWLEYSCVPFHYFWSMEEYLRSTSFCIQLVRELVGALVRNSVAVQNSWVVEWWLRNHLTFCWCMWMTSNVVAILIAHILTVVWCQWICKSGTWWQVYLSMMYGSISGSWYNTRSTPSVMHEAMLFWNDKHRWSVTVSRLYWVSGHVSKVISKE